MNRSQARVCIRDLLQDSPEGASKLHGLWRRRWDCVEVDKEKGVSAVGGLAEGQLPGGSAGDSFRLGLNGLAKVPTALCESYPQIRRTGNRYATRPTGASLARGLHPFFVATRAQFSSLRWRHFSGECLEGERHDEEGAWHPGENRRSSLCTELRIPPKWWWIRRL
jgi:hypothetical protein